MNLLFLILGIGALGAMTIDFSSNEADVEDEDTTEELPHQLLGSDDNDLLIAPMETQSDWDTASPSEIITDQRSQLEIMAGSGDDTLVGENGDVLFGDGGRDVFVCTYNPESSMAPSVISDFEKGNDTVLLRLGGAPLNALSEDNSFDLSNLIAVEQNEDETLIKVDSETTLAFSSILNLNVKWSWHEPDLNAQYENNNDIRNLDGSLYLGSLSDIDVIVTREARFSS